MEQEVDLFEQWESLPEEVIEVLNRYCFDGMKYSDCTKLVLELNKVGYTCDYYLDAEPFGLKKL